MFKYWQIGLLQVLPDHFEVFPLFYVEQNVKKNWGGDEKKFLSEIMQLKN